MGAFRREGNARFSGRSSGRSDRGDRGEFGGRDRDSGRGRRDRDSGRSFSRDRDFGGRSRRGEVQETEVICDKCGKECVVPFKPTAGKPIFCNDCFKKNDNYSSRDNKSSGSSCNCSKDLEQVNEKLDKILKLLEEKF